MPPRRKPKPRPRTRSHVAKRRAKRENLVTKDGNVLFIKVKHTEPRMDPEGNEHRRHYQIETLTNALSKQIRTNDRFVQPSIRQVLGNVQIKSIDLELAEESKYRLVFRVKVSAMNRAQATFGLVAAKNAQEFSELTKKELTLMRILHERMPKLVVEPLKGGTIFLPDRHKRKEFDREIYAYMTAWNSGYHEIGVQANGNFLLQSPSPARLTPAQTQAAKRRMVELILRTYDLTRRNAMSIPIAPFGDFIISKPAQGTPQIKIGGCTDMQNRVSPAKMIHRIVTAEWTVRKKVHRLMPDDAEELVQALTNALGKEEALSWLSQYKKSVKAKRLPELGALDLYTLDALNIP